MVARLCKVALKPAGIAKQRLRGHTLKLFMRRGYCRRSPVNNFNGQLARRRDLSLNALRVFASIELALHKRVYVIPGHLNERRTGLFKFADGKLLKVRLDCDPFISESFH